MLKSHLIYLVLISAIFINKYIKSSVDLENSWKQADNSKNNLLSRGKRNALISKEYLWSGARVPFEFDPELSQDERQKISDNMMKISKATCIKFTKRNIEDEYGIYFKSENGKGCTTAVGKRFKKQMVYLEKRMQCLRDPVILHLLMHVLGVFHQHITRNRDDHLRIIWENIDERHRPYFEKLTTNTSSFDLPYDLDSILHPNPFAFSSNGQKTIVIKGGDIQVGRTKRLSQMDIAKLINMYCR